MRLIASRLDQEAEHHSATHDVDTALASHADYVVVAKPSGWCCATPRVAELLGDGAPIFAEPRLDHGLAHRLDRETSGALLIAKSPRSGSGATSSKL